jgi:hypothetical protein
MVAMRRLATPVAMLLAIGCDKTDPAPTPAAITSVAAPVPPPTSSPRPARSGPTPVNTRETKPLSAKEAAAYQAYEKAFVRGRLATGRKDYPAAIKAFDEALKNSPNDFRARAERGYAKLLAGDLDGAEADLSNVKGSSDVKLWAQVWFNRGLIAQKRGRPEEARHCFARSQHLHATKAAATKLSGTSLCPLQVDRLRPVGPPLASWFDVWKRIAEPHWRRWNPKPTNDATAREALRVGKCEKLCVAYVEKDMTSLHVVVPMAEGKLLVFPSVFESSGGRCGGDPFGGERESAVPAAYAFAQHYERFAVCPPAASNDPYPCRTGCRDGSWSAADAFLDPVAKQSLLRIRQTGPMKDGDNVGGIKLTAKANAVHTEHPACREPIPYVSGSTNAGAK